MSETIMKALPVNASPVHETSQVPTPVPGVGPTTFNDMTRAAFAKLTMVNVLWVLGLIGTFGPGYIPYIPEIQVYGHSLRWYGMGIIVTAAGIEKALRFWWSAKDAGVFQ